MRVMGDGVWGDARAPRMPYSAKDFTLIETIIKQI